MHHPQTRHRLGRYTWGLDGMVWRGLNGLNSRVNCRREGRGLEWLDGRSWRERIVQIIRGFFELPVSTSQAHKSSSS